LQGLDDPVPLARAEAVKTLDKRLQLAIDWFTEGNGGDVHMPRQHSARQDGR
jgi:hypothetical protein